MTVTDTPLSELLGRMARTGEVYELDLPADWLQGRAIYGGLSAALCLQATLVDRDDALPPLRSVQLSFIGPAAERVAMQPTVLRQGKSTAFIGVDLTADGALTARATLCFGKPRDSRLDFVELAAPEVAAPEECEPFLERLGDQAPSFTRHFESRHAGADWPLAGGEAREFCAWIRHRDPAMRCNAVGLAALADALPPAAMAAFEEIAPVSSMTWLFDVLTDDFSTEDGWWLCSSRCERAVDGYASQRMIIWNTSGRAVIVGRQNVAVFY